MVKPLLADLPRAVRHWSRTDPRMAALARKDPPRRGAYPRRPAFASLVHSIANQQVSVQAGATIFRRVEAACGGRLTPESVLAAGEDGLRAAGFSRSKAAYATDLARRVAAKEVDFRRLARASDEEVVAALTEVKGIGTWTAQMFMLFQQHRPDVVAPDDLGLRIAAGRLYGVPMERTRDLLRRKAQAWSPYGSLASLTLWWSRRSPVTTKPS